MSGGREPSGRSDAPIPSRSEKAPGPAVTMNCWGSWSAAQGPRPIMKGLKAPLQGLARILSDMGLWKAGWV